MDIDISIIGFSSLEQTLAALPDKVSDAFTLTSEQLGQALAQDVQDDKLSGQVLQEKSGLLKESIESAVESSGDVISANVFVAGDVPYAAIQEYGGITKAHVIAATQGKALAFNWQGKQVLFAHINHPGSVIPEHSYLRSALEDMQDNIIDSYASALGDALRSI